MSEATRVEHCLGFGAVKKEKIMNTTKQTPYNAAESSAESELSKINEIAKYVQNFADFGLISKQEKDALCKNLDIAMEKVKALKGAKPYNEGVAAGEAAQTLDVIDFERLSENENRFFESRQSLKAYLSEAGVALSREEFEKIFVLVNELERQAVQRYEEFLKGQEILKQSNEEAKQKLQTASAGGFGSSGDVVKKFSPEQIGAMSAAQFRANEHIINEQIRNGDFKGRKPVR